MFRNTFLSLAMILTFSTGSAVSQPSSITLGPCLDKTTLLNLFFTGPFSVNGTDFELKSWSSLTCGEILEYRYRLLAQKVVKGYGLKPYFNDNTHQFLLITFIDALAAINQLSKTAAQSEINPTLKATLLGEARSPKGTIVQYILRTVTEEMHGEIMQIIDDLSKRSCDLVCNDGEPYIHIYHARLM